MRLDCDTVEIKEPAGSLTFSIQPPAGAPNMPVGPFNSDALFHWMRETKSYSMNGAFINQHPYSCTFTDKLGEVLVNANGDPINGIGKEAFDTTRSNADLFISLDSSGPIPTITVDSSYNEFFSSNKGALLNGNEILMMYEASLVGSTSRKTLLFKYFIFVDCLPRDNV